MFFPRSLIKKTITLSYHLSIFQDVKFFIVAAEDLSEVSLKYKIAAVPTFLLLRGGQVVERVNGANAADLTSKVKTQVRLFTSCQYAQELSNILT